MIKPVIIDGKDTKGQVSDEGWFLDSHHKKTFGSKTTAGYYKVCIFKKFYMAHRVVAYAYLGLPQTNPDGSEIKGKALVNHKDGDKTNNRVENLEGCDGTYNMKHGAKDETKIAKKVYRCIENGDVGTSKYFEKKYNIKSDGLAACANPNNSHSSAHGLHFEEVVGE